MATSYPASLDSFANPSPSDLQSSGHANQHANVNDAVEAIEGELGVNPSGPYATVAARLDAIGTASAAITADDTPAAPAEGESASYLVTSAVTWPAGLVWSTDPDGGVAPTITGTALVSLFTVGGVTRAIMGATFPGVVVPDTTAPVWSATLTTGTPAATSVVVAASALATDAVGVTGYERSLDGGSTWAAVTPSGLNFTLSGLTAATSYPAPKLRAKDAAGNYSTTLTAQAFTTAAASVWTPASLTGLAAWYDASDAATITHVAGAVSQWNDKSGNARHVAQATAAAKPTTGTRTQGALNVLDFDAGDRLYLAGVSLAQPVTVALVGKYDAIAYVCPFVALKSTGVYGPYAGDAYWQLYAGTQLVSTTAKDTNPHTMVGILNGASSTLRVDGAQIAAGEAGATAGDAIIIGSFDNVATNDLDGFIGEIVIVGGVVSGADLTNLESYLKAKWGTP